MVKHFDIVWRHFGRCCCNKNNNLVLKYWFQAYNLSVFQNYGSLTRVTRSKVASNMIDPISLFKTSGSRMIARTFWPPFILAFIISVYCSCKCPTCYFCVICKSFVQRLEAVFIMRCLISPIYYYYYLKTNKTLRLL